MVEDFEPPGEEILGVDWDSRTVGKRGAGLVIGRKVELGAMGEIEELQVLGSFGAWQDASLWF